MEKFSTTLTREIKKRERAKIADAVSAVSGIQWIIDAIQKKISTVTSETKRKAALIAKEQKKIGGGSYCAPSLTLVETRIVGLGNV